MVLGPQANRILIVMGAQGALSSEHPCLPEKSFLQGYGEFALP